MKELADVLSTARGPKAARLVAQKRFIRKRNEIWERIRLGRFPAAYTSANDKKFAGAPRRTAIRCDFLLASKIALGAKYKRDPLADMAQRDLLFYVLRGREVFPHTKGKKFYCCPKCTSKLYECVSANVFRYIDNAKWKAMIESH